MDDHRVIILPTSQAERGVERAIALLTEVATERRTVVIVVLGEGDRPREIASRADVRADGHPSRRVIWIPDLSVLDGSDRFGFLLREAGRGVEALALTLAFEPSVRLAGDDATKFVQLEQAFNHAMAGHVLT